MTERTLTEIEADLNSLMRERDLANLAGCKAVAAALHAGKVGTLVDDLTALMPQLSPSSLAAQQTNNVITIVGNVRTLIENEIRRVEDLTAE